MGGAAASAVAAGLACVGLADVAQAAEPDGWLYVVNAGKNPAGFKLDQAETAQLPAFSHLSEPVSAGPHGLATVIGARVASDYHHLELADAGRDARGRAWWCVMVSEVKGAPRMTLVSPDACGALIRGGAPDPTPPTTTAAVGGLWQPQGH